MKKRLSGFGQPFQFTFFTILLFPIILRCEYFIHQVVGGILAFFSNESSFACFADICYPQFGNALPFVYGKINNLYTLQVGFGNEKLLLPAVVDGNLSVSFRYSLGIGLAMLKLIT